MPYGSLEPTLKFSFDYLPGDLFRRFINDARKALPNEFAAWLTWDPHTREFTYRPLTTTSAGPVHLELERPQLEVYEHLVVDIHSHAHVKAFFSSEDNLDDRGEVKLSVVPWAKTRR
jgi:PRTRC genetic system protein A